MTSPDEARQRLADLMEDRRADLRLRWEDVARAGGISVKGLQDARSGSTAPRRSTLRGIDAGLRWKPGSAEQILAGGEADPLPGDTHLPPGVRLAERRAALDPAWRDPSAFAAARGISEQLAASAESGSRQGFTPAELAALEDAYELAAGSLERSLASGELEVRDAGPDPGWLVRLARLPRDDYDRELGRVLRRLQELRSSGEGSREAG